MQFRIQYQLLLLMCVKLLILQKLLSLNFLHQGSRIQTEEQYKHTIIQLHQVITDHFTCINTISSLLHIFKYLSMT